MQHTMKVQMFRKDDRWFYDHPPFPYVGGRREEGPYGPFATRDEALLDAAQWWLHWHSQICPDRSIGFDIQDYLAHAAICEEPHALRLDID